MNIRNTVPAVVGAVLALGASSAFATPVKLTGSYTVSEQYTSSHGGPSITKNLADPFSVMLTNGVKTSPMNFFTTGPAGSCSGGGCSGYRGTETDKLTVTFSNLGISGIGDIASLTETGIFTAKYSGSELSCAVGDSRSPTSGDTDCFIWSGAADKYNASTMLTETLGHGYDLDITFYNAADWNITPQIGFELVKCPTVPEPATFALFAAGLAALGWTLSRRRKAS